MSSKGAIALAVGGGLAAGFVLGNVTGFFAGVYSTKAGREFLEDLATTEGAADTKHPHEINRKGFRLKYPGNWTIDTKDEDYDPDHLFTIESPGSSFTMMIITPEPTDPADDIRSMVDAYVPKLLKDPRRTPFTKWGAYLGRGVELRGRVMGINRGGLRIFAHASPTVSFTVVELYFDDDLTMVKPGLQLIASSFSLRESSESSQEDQEAAD